MVDATSGHMVTRTLLADTGAGGLDAPFELILRVSDGEQYMGLRSSDDVQLGGAIVDTYPIYALRVEFPRCHSHGGHGWSLSLTRRVQL